MMVVAVACRSGFPKRLLRTLLVSKIHKPREA
jgi:hypothetical protein